VRELSPRDVRRVWALTKELFIPKSWTVPKSIEDFRVSNPLLRELRLTDRRELLLTDSGLTALRATVALLDELDPSEGLAGYSDIWSVCRRVLEDCLSKGAEPEDGQEYMRLVAAELDSRIASYTYIVPLFGVELEGIDDMTVGGFKIVRPSKQLIDNLGLQYSAEHLDIMLEETKRYLWLMGTVRGTAGASKDRFNGRCRLVCGLLAVTAASIYELGSHGFRIGVITTPEEGHGRAMSLSWKDDDLELRISSKFVRAQPFKVNRELLAHITESTLGRRANSIVDSDNRTPLEEAWVRAIYWYSDAHRDQTPVMRFLKFWSCAETFFSSDRAEISESVSFGLAATVVYGDFRSAQPPEFRGLKKRLKRMYRQRSAATHRGSYSHVSEKDVADLSQWIGWMLVNMVAFSCRGLTTPDEATELLRRRASFAPKSTVKYAIDIARRVFARAGRWFT
jgi:hypothetical protein